ncbi:hypothetical protein SLA2020_214360 [Shorea laevis]
MEIYSMHGVGIPTERAYVYKLTPAAKCYIPFLIDTSAEGRSEHSCLKGAVFSTNGDETAPVFSAGYMSAKGWRGKTNSTLQSSVFISGSILMPHQPIYWRDGERKVVLMLT